MKIWKISLILLLVIICLTGCIKKSQKEDDVLHEYDSKKYSLKIEVCDKVNSSTDVFVDGQLIKKSLKSSSLFFALYYDIVYIYPGKHSIKWVTNTVETVKDSFNETVTYKTTKVERFSTMDILENRLTLYFDSAKDVTSCIIKRDTKIDMPKDYSFYVALSKKYNLSHYVINQGDIPILPTFVGTSMNEYNYNFITGVNGVTGVTILNTETGEKNYLSFDLYSSRVEVVDYNNIIYQFEYQ